MNLHWTSKLVERFGLRGDEIRLLVAILAADVVDGVLLVHVLVGEATEALGIGRV